MSATDETSHVLDMDLTSPNPNVLTFDDLLQGSPELPVLDEDSFRGLETCGFPSLADLDDAWAVPIRQDPLSKSVASEAPLHEQDPQMQDLLTSLDLSTMHLMPQNDLTSTPRIDPCLLQESDIRPSAAYPFALPEFGQASLSESGGYETRPLPPLPLFSDQPPTVPPKNNYNSLPWPLLPFFTSNPPVPPKDNFNQLTPGALRSANSLLPHLICFGYPHQPLTAVPAYADVEDLALDPEERPNLRKIIPPVEAQTLAASPIEISSPPQAASWDAAQKERRLRLRRLRYKKNKQEQQRQETLKQLVTHRMLGSGGPQDENLAAAAATTEANAGKSGYTPRQHQLTGQKWLKSKDPTKGPVTIPLRVLPKAPARSRAADVDSSSFPDTDWPPQSPPETGSDSDEDMEQAPQSPYEPSRSSEDDIEQRPQSPQIRSRRLDLRRRRKVGKGKPSDTATARTDPRKGLVTLGLKKKEGQGGGSAIWSSRLRPRRG